MFRGAVQITEIEVPVTVAFGAAGASGAVGKVTEPKIPAVDAPMLLVAVI